MRSRRAACESITTRRRRRRRPAAATLAAAAARAGARHRRRHRRRRAGRHRGPLRTATAGRRRTVALTRRSAAGRLRGRSLLKDARAASLGPARLASPSGVRRRAIGGRAGCGWRARRALGSRASRRGLGLRARRRRRGLGRAGRAAVGLAAPAFASALRRRFGFGRRPLAWRRRPSRRPSSAAAGAARPSPLRTPSRRRPLRRWRRLPSRRGRPPGALPGPPSR